MSILLGEIAQVGVFVPADTPSVVTVGLCLIYNPFREALLLFPLLRGFPASHIRQDPMGALTV